MKSALFSLLFWSLTAFAVRADIDISPLRHVLSEASSEATVSISNPSQRILDGQVSWVDLKATETGYAPADIETRKRLSAAPYLTLSPAYFRLEPGARVEVTIKFKKGMRLPRGERRSHLLIETGASRTPLRNASNNGLQVDVGLGVSTPVILRNGKNASGRFGETRLLRDENGSLILATSIASLGDISTYGRVTATFKTTGSAPDAVKALGVRDNIAGYLEAGQRKVEIPLGYESLGQGELTLRYEGVEEFNGRLFDERKFDIAPPG
ncbi:MAG: hypothetical protein AAFX54_18510 [Pseudomonadota bacterium]